MTALRLLLIFAVFVPSTLPKPKSYINEGDRDEQENIINSNLQYMRHQYDIANGNNHCCCVIRFISEFMLSELQSSSLPILACSY